MRIEPRFGFRSEIEVAIERNYGPIEAASPLLSVVALRGDENLGMEFIWANAQQRNVEALREIQVKLQQKSKTTPAVLVVASAIRAAARKASDIHVVPQAGDTVIRFRVDESSAITAASPKRLIKILADMEIAERRAPQDGRFVAKIGERRVDLRVSTLPTQYGEKVVMRLLEADAPLQDFSELGFPQSIDVRLKKILRQPQGMVQITGPTGSAKSTKLAEKKDRRVERGESHSPAGQKLVAE